MGTTETTNTYKKILKKILSTHFYHVNKRILGEGARAPKKAPRDQRRQTNEAYWSDREESGNKETVLTEMEKF